MRCFANYARRSEAAMPTALEDKLKKIAESIGVPKIRRHIFLCCDQTKPKCSDKDRSLESWEYLKARLKELNLVGEGGVYRTKANLSSNLRERPDGSRLPRRNLVSLLHT